MTGDISTIPVPEQDRLDEAALTAWMETNVAGFRGPLPYAKFAGGQSNPPYRLDSPSGRYEIRRAPFWERVCQYVSISVGDVALNKNTTAPLLSATEARKSNDD